MPDIVHKITWYNHQDNGKTLRVLLRNHLKEQRFTFLPKRIAARLSEEDVETFPNDIGNKKPPFLVFRGLKGQAFDVDLLKFGMFF